jgi:DNA-binding NtrC family response regulator
MAVALSDAAPRGSETILLVVPDAQSRASMAFMLTRLGYTVLEAHNAMEAVKIYGEDSPAIDLLLTEVRMPRVDGHELAQSLAGRDDGLRVLFLAEADDARLARRSASRKRLAYLARPFTSRLLAEGVRAVLDRPAERPRVLTAGIPA